MVGTSVWLFRDNPEVGDFRGALHVQAGRKPRLMPVSGQLKKSLVAKALALVGLARRTVGTAIANHVICFVRNWQACSGYFEV